MASRSVSTKQHNSDVRGSSTDLFLRGGDCLTVRLDRGCNEFPPGPDSLERLHDTLIDLAKAVEIIGADLPQDEDLWRYRLALNGLADAIALHATLARAVSTEICGKDAEALAAAA